MTSVPLIRREVLVEAGPELAFEIFTARIGAWWPLADFSVHGTGATVSFSGDRLVERSPAGEAAVWGTVTRWEPPHAVAFTWHPGAGPDRASDVAVTFTPAGEQTAVTREHSGWESFEDPAAARAEYDQGWPAVLEAYREAAGAAGQPGRRGCPAGHRGRPERGRGAVQHHDQPVAGHARGLTGAFLLAAGQRISFSGPTSPFVSASRRS